MNVGILISVTRIISRISGENYKVHGDANAVKWVCWLRHILLMVQHIYFVESFRYNHVYLSVCLQTDSQSRGCAPAHSWHFLDLRCSCCQHTLAGIFVYLCCIQLITSKFFSFQSFFWLKIWCHSCYIFYSFIFRGFSSSCFTVSSTLRYVAKHLVHVFLLIGICFVSFWVKYIFLIRGLCWDEPTFIQFQSAWVFFFFFIFRSELRLNTKPKCGLLPAVLSETSTWNHSTQILWVLMIKHNI